MWASLLFPLLLGAETILFPQEPGPEDFDYRTIEIFKSYNMESVLVAFHGDPSLRSSPLQKSFYLEQDGELDGRFLISNMTDRDFQYKMFCFVDYRPVPFTMDGMESLNHRVAVKGRRETVEAVAVSVEDADRDGMVDLLFVLLDEESGDYNFFYHRANVYVGGRLSQVPPGETPWRAVEEKAETTEALFWAGAREKIRVRNGEETETRFFVMLFDPEKAEVVGRHSLKIPGAGVGEAESRSLPGHSGGNLRALVVENPFMRLERERGLLVGKPQKVFLASTMEKENDDE